MRLLSNAIVLGMLAVGTASAAQVGPGYYVEDVTFTETLPVPNSAAITQPRSIVDIPANYGRLITITKDNSGAPTLWFEGADGIRNVTLSTVSGPLLIKRR